MEHNKWSGILVYIETAADEVLPVSRELIGEAFRLAAITGEKVYGIAVGTDPVKIKAELRGYRLAAIRCYRDSGIFRARLYEQAMNDCISRLRPAVVLIGGTRQGRALAPRVAVAFRTGVTADCTQLDIDESGCLVQTRPAFGGNIMASILTVNSRPQIATVRQGIFALPAREQNCPETDFTVIDIPSLPGRETFIRKTVIERKEGIAKQDILVAAGRGVRSKEDLEQLRELAALLGGRLASSRALVEKGWMKPEEQIGLSGNTVAPQCLITFGVSGTVQFIAGMKQTPNIIAVNTDPRARIFEIAHYPVCADLYDVVPELIRLLQKKS